MTEYLKKILGGSFFTYFNLILLILVIASSYYRFVVLNDYLVAYEGDCDPEIESCYEYCENGECYYYSIIERQAAEINQLCGSDPTACDEAYECQPDVDSCTIYFCDPEADNEENCVGNLN